MYRSCVYSGHKLGYHCVCCYTITWRWFTVYPKKYAHGFVVLCFVVVMQSSIMNSHEVFIHIHKGCFAGTGAIVRLPQCQWSKPDGYGKISQYITTTKHSKAKTVCIFLGIYCTFSRNRVDDKNAFLSEIYVVADKYVSNVHIGPFHKQWVHSLKFMQTVHIVNVYLMIIGPTDSSSYIKSCGFGSPFWLLCDMY